MNLRIARKIERAVRRRYPGRRYSRDQIRRACLRVYLSPIQCTQTGVNFHDRSVQESIGRALRGRSMVISPRLAIFESRYRPFDIVKEGDRWLIQPRT